MNVLKSFLGCKRESGISKGWQIEPAGILRVLFLIGFTYAYACFPSSIRNSKDHTSCVPKARRVTKPKKEFSQNTSRNLKTDCSQQRLVRESQKQKIHYIHEPLCQLVRHIRSSKFRSRREMRKLESPLTARRSSLMKPVIENDVFVREASKQDNVKGIEEVNPNSNVDLFSTSSVSPVIQIQLTQNQQKQDLVILSEGLNPNSDRRLDRKLGKCPGIRSKRKNNTNEPWGEKLDEKADLGNKFENCVPMKSSDFLSQHQQKLENEFPDALLQIEQQNQVLKLSVLNNKDRVANIRKMNDQLLLNVKDKDDQLKLKDDLIQKLQTKMINYEAISPTTGALDIDACQSNIREDQQEEISYVRNRWLGNELQSEKPITKLVDSLILGKEQANPMLSKVKGSEGWLETEQNRRDSFLLDEPGSLLKSQAECAIPAANVQQMLSENKSAPEQCTEDNLKMRNTELQLLKEQNRELELQLSQSGKTIGELSVEKRKLENLNTELTYQLEQPSTSNTQVQEQAEPGQFESMVEIPKVAVQPKRSKGFSVSRLLSCRKIDINRNGNRSENGRKRVITRKFSPDLGRP